MDWHTRHGLRADHAGRLRDDPKSGFYDKNPGADLAVKQLTNKPPTGELQGPALRQLRAGARGDRGGDGERVLRQEGRRRRRSTTRSSAATRSCASSRPPTSTDAQEGAGRHRRPLRLAPAMEKRVVFRSAWLPYALVAPQIAITIVFFFWPAAQAVWYSFQLQDAFGLKTQFVGLAELRRAVQGQRTTSSRSRSRRCSASLVAFVRHRASRCCSPTMADRVLRGAHRLQDAADLALRGGARGRRRAVGVPVRALDRHRHLRAEEAAASTGTGSSRATRRCCWS